MAIFRSRSLYLEIIHDDLLAGIHPQLVLPHCPQIPVVDDDLLLFGRTGKGAIRAGKAFDAEHLFLDPPLAE